MAARTYLINLIKEQERLCNLSRACLDGKDIEKKEIVAGQKMAEDSSQQMEFIYKLNKCLSERALMDIIHIDRMQTLTDLQMLLKEMDVDNNDSAR